MNKNKSDIGIIGMGVMGRNLALNFVDHGISAAVWNRTPDLLELATKESQGRLTCHLTLGDLLSNLELPRKVLLLIPAGRPVDEVIEGLGPFLTQGDIVMDGGNSHYNDTARREEQLARSGVCFYGIGVSGGEAGARHGPSLMPGGAKQVYPSLQPMLEAIAARTDSGPCVTYVGPGGAGHFVKMVHNGIEYADMQLIAEAYSLLREGLKLSTEATADVFESWNRGPLESFLVDLTARVLRVKDPEGNGYLVDRVLDKAGQKGTGKWAMEAALDLDVPIPSLSAALTARILSGLKEERAQASETLIGPFPRARHSRSRDRRNWIEANEQALYASKIAAYAQGMALIRAASREHSWGISLREMARIWTGGCIIRARVLGELMGAFERQPDLANLMLDREIWAALRDRLMDWREVLSWAFEIGIPVPAMSASLGYLESYRTKNLPQNLTQAQRDAFGAHLYQRVDAADGPFIHTAWL